jgi:hypothetical protein
MKNNGFAMLFTVLIVSIILSIGLGISNLTFKQTVLSSLAKDSEIAFNQADTATECGMYYDLTIKLFPRGTTVSNAASTLVCGSNALVLDTAKSYTDHFVYNESLGNLSQPCYSVVFDKAASPTASVVEGRGYNICTLVPRQVERTLQVTY